jgi:hypothetical protein
MTFAPANEPWLDKVPSDWKRRRIRIPGTEERKNFVYLLARLAKACHFLTCFFTYPPPRPHHLQPHRLL